MSYLKGLGNSVQSQGGFKKWPISDVDPLLESIFFSLKSPFLRGFSGTFLASNVTQVTVISGWNGSYGSMGPEGHIRSLDVVMRVLTGAHWVQNGRLRGSFLA